MAFHLPHISAENWIAIGTVGNFVVVIVLAFLTNRYSRDVKRQADAAQAQARAAEQTLAALREQRDNERTLGWHLVFAFIDSAIERLSTWENRMSGESYPQLPMPIGEVLPAGVDDALQEAYRLSDMLGAQLRAAVEEAHKAEQDIRALSTASTAHPKGWLVPMRSAYGYLREARHKLNAAKDVAKEARRAAVATG